MQTLVTAENKKCLRVRFFKKFWLWLWVWNKTQNPAGFDSGTPDPRPPLPRCAQCLWHFKAGRRLLLPWNET